MTRGALAASFWQRWRSGRAEPAARWVVLDVESSGLDPRHDRLLAVAAVALRAAPDRLALCPADSFEAVLGQPADDAGPDRANILVHGIGVGAQAQGVAPAEALEAFERWVGASPLIAFHSAFDERLLQRAMQATLGRVLPGPWLDLAQLAPAVAPGVPGRSLDDWLRHVDIPCARRHQAAADAHATARLLLRLWPAVRAQRAGEDFAALRHIAAQARWLPR